MTKVFKILPNGEISPNLVTLSACSRFIDHCYRPRVILHFSKPLHFPGMEGGGLEEVKNFKMAVRETVFLDISEFVIRIKIQVRILRVISISNK